MCTWINENREWLFSGIGVTLVVAIIGGINSVFKHKNAKNTETILRQENRNHSHGVQIGVQNNYEKKDDE